MREWIKPTDPAFTYEGRIDFEDADAPVFVWPCSYFRFHLKGSELAVIAQNKRSYFESSLGVLVDGEYRGKILLHDGERTQGERVCDYCLRLCPEKESLAAGELLSFFGKSAKETPDNLKEARVYDLSAFLDGGDHEITVFKRMDACHYFTLYGMIAEAGSVTGVHEVKGMEVEGGGNETEQVKKERRIEVYGDSISCGEVSEAIALCGQCDPEGHNGIYSNSFYSYSWILARRLGARLHDTSQGGIALQDGEGYFNEPDRRGMISTYNKIQYNPSLGPLKNWDLKKYIPQVVIIAIGQNDHHPVNYMAEDYNGESAQRWRRKYKEFIGILRDNYPNAQIILTTTILGHDPEWDRAIDEVCKECNDPKVHHFLYSLNGCGTSGHIRRPEAERMAEEMKAFIDSLGEIWGE